MPEDQIAIALTLLRSVRGWNQDALAKASGVRNSAISDYERGCKLPELATLRCLLDAMGYPLSAIDLTRQYVEALRAGGNALSSFQPLTTTSEPWSSEGAVRWEIEQAAPDLARAMGRVVKIALLLLLRGAKPPDIDDSSAGGLRR